MRIVKAAIGDFARVTIDGDEYDGPCLILISGDKARALHVMRRYAFDWSGHGVDVDADSVTFSEMVSTMSLIERHGEGRITLLDVGEVVPREELPGGVLD